MKQSILSLSGASQNHSKYMKRILLALTFVGTLAACLAGFAKHPSAAGDATATPASATPAKDTASPGAALDAAPAAQAPAPAAAPVVADNVAPPAAPANPAPASETPATAPDAPKPVGPPQPSTVIPLIVMDDVPLTDAIRNLARQAGLNYLLDPSIGFGQVGTDGKPTPQPSVSIRWENITAEQALNALLNNYTLQLVEDPKSKIARITRRDPAAAEPLFTKIIQLKFASPSNIIASAQSTLIDKRSKVMPDIRTSQLVVVATEKELVAVDELVQHLDTQTKQVLIEARLLETMMNPATSKGVDWSGTLKAQNVSFGNGITTGTTTTTAPGTPTTTTLPGGGTVTTSPSSSANTVLSSMLGNGGLRPRSEEHTSELQSL